MDAIILFLEKYWGYSLAGGITLGTIVTFVTVQIKVLLKDKKRGFLVDTLMTKLDAEIERNQSLETANTALVQQSVASQQVQAVTFKAISYLVLASKLPTEEKLALQEDFNNLKSTIIVNTVPTVKKEAKGIIENVIDDAKESFTNIVVDTVSQGQTLLEKYVTGDK